MCDTSDIPRGALRATPGHEKPSPYTSCPETPLPGDSRALRRTISHVSIDTVRPSSNKGVRRCINEIAENLKHKSTKKKKISSTQDALKNADHDLASASKAPPTSKETKRGRKPTAPLRDSLHRSEEETVLAIADRLHRGIPSERDSSLTILGCKSALIDKGPAQEGERLRKFCDFPASSFDLAEHQDISQWPQSPKIGIKDIQLDIQPSESNMTIWDGLQAEHHLFKCRLYLRCTTHPYDAVSVPDIYRVEMDCNTCPVGSHYTRSPVLRLAYEGASPGWATSPDVLPNVEPTAGIHMDKFWRTVSDEDGTWGWYRDVFVPLSPRLFDKMDYREFKLVSRVWLGETCMEAELIFGISMLLQEVDMK